ncbi:GAF sensor signal transduction histidine kinase [Chondrocystis sp. NIES-4102]|nr:GAF sensor signal transduction histidine kinase [Chondrocystis sp. NIES-4102]
MPKTMQDTLGVDEIKNSILQLILESSNSMTLLSELAMLIGNWLLAETCMVFSTINFENIDTIGYWQSAKVTLPPTVKSQIVQQLSNLELNDHGSSSRLSDVTRSSGFSPLDHLLQTLLPNKISLAVTTKYQGQINGLILLLRSQSSEWTHSERELLSNISNSMAIAFSQVQLQQQAQIKARYQSLLKHLSREISQSTHPQSLFHTCLAKICTTLKVDRGMLLMLKYQNPLMAKARRPQVIKGTVKIAAYWSLKAENLTAQEELAFNLHDSDLCQQAWQNAPECLSCDSNTPFPDLITSKLPTLVESRGSALLMIPLMGKKNGEKDNAVVLGFLVCQQNSPRCWSEDELDLIDWISVQMSTAIIHHQTLNQVQSIVDERTAQLKSSLDVQAKLSAKMRQHIEQLQKLNQLKDDFMNSMSHELKTPLTSMKMAIKMLRQAEISPAMREKYLNILEQEWNREYGLIKDLLTLQEVESGKLTYSPQELDLNTAIERMAGSFRNKWQSEKGLLLNTSISQTSLKINTDPESLEHILNELLLNAGKYADPNTTIELSVISQVSFKGRDIVITITNEGAGITPEELPYIFDKFRRGQGVTDRAVPGTGLGLTLVKYLVEHLNGTIEVSSDPTFEDETVFITSFVLKLPQFQPTIS